MLKTCAGCGTRYAWSLSQCPHDGNVNYLESGEVVDIIDPVSTATTGTLAVEHVAQVDATSAACARTLPLAATAGVGKRLIVRKVDSSVNAVTINRDGSDTIDGSTTYVLSGAGEGVELVSDGSSSWIVVQTLLPNPLLDSIFLTEAEGSETYATRASNLSDLASASSARTNLAVPGVVEAPIWLNPGSMDSASGSPTEANVSAGSTFVPAWQMPKAAASSVVGVVTGLPSQCVGVQIDATLLGSSDASASTAILRIVGTSLVSGSIWSTLQWSDNVVLCNSLPSANGMAKFQRLETFLPVDDPTVPLAIRVIREVTDGLDTWGGNINLGAIRVTPVVAPPTPETVSAASGYKSWPFLLQVGGKLTVIYSVGTQHGQPDTGRRIVSRSLESDGTWSAEATILDTPGSDDRAVGKGYDASGNPLIWVNVGGTHYLYRYSGGSWSLHSSPSSGWGTTPIQVTDVLVLPSSLMSFWHSGTTDGNCAYGKVESTDGGATWTQTVIASGLTVSAAPTEISGVYVGSDTILALGRCETGDVTSGSGMHQIHSTDGGSSWSKNRSNVFDHYKSTPTLVWDGTSVHAYYYRRLWGDLRRRTVTPATVIAAPRAWPVSSVIAVGGSRLQQDAGNPNALIVDAAHKVAYYSGTATDTAIMLVTV